MKNNSLVDEFLEFCCPFSKDTIAICLTALHYFDDESLDNCARLLHSLLQRAIEREEYSFENANLRQILKDYLNDESSNLIKNIVKVQEDIEKVFSIDTRTSFCIGLYDVEGACELFWIDSDLYNTISKDKAKLASLSTKTRFFLKNANISKLGEI